MGGNVNISPLSPINDLSPCLVPGSVGLVNSQKFEPNEITLTVDITQGVVDFEKKYKVIKPYDQAFFIESWHIAIYVDSERIGSYSVRANGSPVSVKVPRNSYVTLDTSSDIADRFIVADYDPIDTSEDVTVELSFTAYKPTNYANIIIAEETEDDKMRVNGDPISNYGTIYCNGTYHTFYTPVPVSSSFDLSWYNWYTGRLVEYENVEYNSVECVFIGPSTL